MDPTPSSASHLQVSQPVRPSGPWELLSDVWRTTPASALWLLTVIASTLLLLALALSLRLMVQLKRRGRAHDLAMPGAHDGFWSWNPRTKRLEVGKRLLNILGYDENFLPDTHAWLELVHPDDRANYNQTVAEHLKGGTPYCYCEYRVRAKSGDYCWIASRGLARRDRNGRADLMAGSVTDITERKKREDEIRFLAFHDSSRPCPTDCCWLNGWPQHWNMPRPTSNTQRFCSLIWTVSRTSTTPSATMSAIYC